MLGPLFSMILLTFLVGIYTVIVRINAVKSGAVSPAYFRYNTSDSEPPAKVLTSSRHFSNLFEMPVLFYVACLLAIITHSITTFMVTCAWLYVAARIVHAFVHLSSNNVRHRMYAFLLSVVILAALWVSLALKLL